MRTKIFTTNLFHCERHCGHDMTNLATAKTVKAFLILETIPNYFFFIIPCSFCYSNPSRSRNFFTLPQPSPNPQGESKKFTNDARIAI